MIQINETKAKDTKSMAEDYNKVGPFYMIDKSQNRDW